MKRVFILAALLNSLLLGAWAQQSSSTSTSALPNNPAPESVYVNRWDFFAGYSYLTSPTIMLDQNGFNGSGGVNVTRWLGLGIDFSYFGGSNNLSFNDTVLPGQITTNILDKCTSPFPACFPSVPILQALGNFYAPSSVRTITVAAGPQFNVRRVKESTLFVRPGLGIIHESANVNTATVMDEVSAYCGTPTGMFFCSSPEGMQVIGATSAAASKPHMADTVIFYGAGAGVDVNFSRRIGARFSVDYVHCHLFPNLLPFQDNIRFSVGPTFRFGDISKGK